MEELSNVASRPVLPGQAHGGAADGDRQGQHGLGEVERTAVLKRAQDLQDELTDHLVLAFDGLDGHGLLQPGAHNRVPGRVGGRDLPSARRVLDAEDVQQRAALGREGVRVAQHLVCVVVVGHRPEAVLLVGLLPGEVVLLA
jgi:hypothetical protein